MKLRVVGWMDYDDISEMPSGNGEWAARNAIIDDIRKNGYSFSGWAHQEGCRCAPVLNDGKLYCYSQRGWGDLMSEAHESMDPMGYSDYLFPVPSSMEQRPAQSRRYDRSFVPETDLNETFEVSIEQDAFESAERDHLVLFRDYEDLRYLGKGDVLVLVCGEQRASYLVEDAERVHDVDEERLEQLRGDSVYGDAATRKRAREELNRLSLVLRVELRSA